MANEKIILPINSRYKDTNLYTDSADNTFFGTWQRLEIQDETDYELYQITKRDIGRFDLIAFDFYGDTSLFWVILDFNNIVDPIFGIEIGQKIKIPSKDQVLRALMD